MSLFAITRRNCHPSIARWFASFCARPTRFPFRRLAFGATVGIGTCLAFLPKNVYLDSQAFQKTPDQVQEEDAVVDSATSISFPKSMRMPANVKLPPLTLVGVGVRSVSFLGIKVYSVGFYADLHNPSLKIPLDMSPEDKVKHIVCNTSCAIRIVPTRTTSYTHLRDAFMRALNTRLALGVKEGTVTNDIAQEAGSPMRKLKSLFPNSPLAKHTPLDIYLSAPLPNRPRALVFRDLGSIESDWVATEFVLNYFEGDGPSPPLKKSVLEYLKTFKS